MPDYRETTITIDHDAKVAHIWTNIARIIKRLKGVGAIEVDNAGNGVWLRLSENAIRFRKQRKLTGRKGNPGALAAYRASKEAK